MHRTAVIRFGAALALGLVMSALGGGLVASAASPSAIAMSVRPNTCLRPRVFVDDVTVDVTSSVNPSRFGQSVTFTATVTPNMLCFRVRPAFLSTPTGTVDFKNNTKPLCTGAVLDGSGVATCITSGLVVGDHAIDANYNGDQNYNPETASLEQVVLKAGTHSVISSSSRNSSFGQAVTLGVYVFTSKPGGGIPKGTFQFKIDGVKFGSPVALGADGRAFLPSMSDLSVGPHLIGGNYSGDSNHRESTPVRLLQYVNSASPIVQ
jgi:hypothetical protein